MELDLKRPEIEGNNRFTKNRDVCSASLVLKKRLNKMKKRLVIGLSIVFIVLAITAIAFSYQGWRVQNWDKSKVITLEGKITDADRPIITMEANGKEYIIHLGKPSFWKNQDMKIEKGTSIKITGMVLDINGKMNIYPQSVVIGEKEIKVSDENGVPVWAGNGGKFRHGKHGWQGQGNGMGFGGRNCGACPCYKGRW